MRLVAIDYPGFEPWDLEIEAAVELGVEWELVAFADFHDRPVPCDILINGGAWPLPPETLDRIPDCRFIVSFGSGMDWIDVDDATARGILVARTPNANTEDVATHALALILACVRRLVECDAEIRRGDFPSVIKPIHRLQGRRLGLLSFGNVPRRLVEIVAPLGPQIRAHDPFVPDAVMRAHGVEPAGLDELLQWSDILSVHTPATGETVNLLDAKRLSQLPRGAIVVITSRGAVYDPEALAALLHDGHLAAAGLDVFPDEPPAADDDVLAAPRATLTPHIAGYSEEAVRDYHLTAVDAVRAFARGETPATAVNHGALVTRVARGDSMPSP